MLSKPSKDARGPLFLMGKFLRHHHHRPVLQSQVCNLCHKLAAPRPEQNVEALWRQREEQWGVHMYCPNARISIHDQTTSGRCNTFPAAAHARHTRGTTPTSTIHTIAEWIILECAEIASPSIVVDETRSACCNAKAISRATLGGSGMDMFLGMSPICPDTNIHHLSILHSTQKVSLLSDHTVGETLTVMLWEYGPIFAGAQ